MAESDQPKKETVRIELPLAEEKSSMVPYWLLLGLSALILIIQIWIYFS